MTTTTPWTGRQLEVTYRPVAELLPYARNARTHTDAQVAEIAGSIKAFGWTNPVLVREDGVVVAGHGRIRAAQLLGMELVPTIELGGLTDVQARALTLADNRIALNAGWDAEMLSAELTDLRDLGATLDGLGFTEAELAAALSPPTKGLTDPDAVPPVPDVPVSRPGDAWTLGRHRLLCGDATVEGDVERLLCGVTPHLMVTDPPYGFEYDPAWRGRDGLGVSSIGTVESDDRADWREAWALFPGDVAYVWHAALHGDIVKHGLTAAGFVLRAQIIWRKQRSIISRGAYHWQHEPCWYAVRKGATGHWAGDRKQSTVWDINDKQDAENVRTGHGTQKPVECMRRPIQNNSSPGQAVYDPFAGSGTTIIAAEQTSRSCFAIELSPAYVDVAVLRWCAFTGLPAVLDETNQFFETVAAQRAGVTA